MEESLFHNLVTFLTLHSPEGKLTSLFHQNYFQNEQNVHVQFLTDYHIIVINIFYRRRCCFSCQYTVSKSGRFHSINIKQIVSIYFVEHLILGCVYSNDSLPGSLIWSGQVSQFSGSTSNRINLTFGVDNVRYYIRIITKQLLLYTQYTNVSKYYCVYWNME